MLIINKIKLNSVIFTWSLIFCAVASVVAFSFIVLKPAWAALGDYDRTGVSLSPDDWNYLDEDFVLKEGATMGGDINMNNIAITNLALIPADTTSAVSAAYVDSRINASAGGTTYTNWG